HHRIPKRRPRPVQHLRDQRALTARISVRYCAPVSRRCAAFKIALVSAALGPFGGAANPTSTRYGPDTNVTVIGTAVAPAAVLPLVANDVFPTLGTFAFWWLMVAIGADWLTGTKPTAAHFQRALSFFTRPSYAAFAALASGNVSTDSDRAPGVL